MTTLLVVAGEASGDLHGGEILQALKARRPDLRVVGVGGDRMSPHLDRKLADVGDLGVVGFLEVVKHLPEIYQLRKTILQVAKDEAIQATLFIDYPGFNLSLAKSLRKALPAVRLHQYVCPQVWAWKKGRVPVLGRTLDTLYCLFDFEPRLFEGLPVEAIWVGNPLVETVHAEVNLDVFLRETGLNASKPLVALLPGSRRGELQRLLPPMLDLVRRWQTERPEVQWVLPVAPTLTDAEVAGMLGDLPVRRVGANRTYAARAYADAALVASGTATLETAILGTPFAIVYKLHPLTYSMARRMVKLPHFGLANVVAGREVAPELVQAQVSADGLAPILDRLLKFGTRQAMAADFAGIRARLGEPGAADRVAEHLLSKLE